MGDPIQYLKVALREAANAKAKSNKLGCHQPNLVVANYALNADAQLALARLQGLSHSLPDVCFSENVDAFAFAAKGIDGALSKHDLKLVMARSENLSASNQHCPPTNPSCLTRYSGLRLPRAGEPNVRRPLEVTNHVRFAPATTRSSFSQSRSLSTR